MIDEAAAVARTVVATRNADEGAALIQDAYVRQRLRLFGDAAGYRLEIQSATAGGLGYDYFTHSMAYATRTDPIPAVLAVLVRRGLLTASAGQQHARCVPGDVMVYLPGHEQEITTHDPTLDALRLPYDELARVAAETSGINASDFRIDGMLPVSTDLAHSWRALAAYVGRELHAPHSALANALVRAETLRLLAVSALRTFPNTAMTTSYVAGPGGVAPAAVRRAVAFIDANADRALTVDDIAAAAGTSARAVQHAFARHQGATPMAYLRRVRLERAHHDLQVADPTRGDTVSEVAGRWGFTNAGRFASFYRETYGTSPSRTLRT